MSEYTFWQLRFCHFSSCLLVLCFWLLKNKLKIGEMLGILRLIPITVRSGQTTGELPLLTCVTQV